jgi:hypothetical protein
VTVGAHAASAEGEGAVTAADGDGLFGFDFGQLPVGSYRLKFTEPDGGGGVWATEWYDNKSSHATATNVAVTEADLALPPVLLQLVIQAEPYTDVSSSHTAYDAVRYIFTYNLLEGITGTTFEPSSSLSRAEFVRLIYRLAGRPAACDPGYSEPFVDVAGSHFAHAAITWATCNPAGPEPPIATGADATHFEPGEDLTRGPAARMAYRLAGELSTTGLPAHPFTDVSGGLNDAVTWAYWDADGGGPLLRLISGITATTFVPSGSLTRGQAANLVWRLARSEPHWDETGGSAFWPDPTTVPGSVLFR